MSEVDNLLVKNVLYNMLPTAEVVLLMQRVLQKKFPGVAAAKVPLWKATILAKALKSHAAKGRHSAAIRTECSALYELQRAHMGEALKVVTRANTATSLLVRISEEHVQKLINASGLLYSGEAEFLWSCLDQQRLGYTLSAKQISWLSKIDHRYQKATAPRTIAVPVSGGFR